MKRILFLLILSVLSVPLASSESTASMNMSLKKFAPQTTPDDWLKEAHSYCVGYCVKTEKHGALTTDATLAVALGTSPDLAFVSLQRYCDKLHDGRGKQYRLNKKNRIANSCSDESGITAHNFQHTCHGTCQLSDLKHPHSRKYEARAKGLTPASAYSHLAHACDSNATDVGHLFTLNARDRIAQICN